MSKVFNDERIIGGITLDAKGNDATATPWGYAAAAGGIVSSTADIVLKGAGGAGVVNYLNAVQISHDTLGGPTEFVIKDGATVLYRGKIQTASMEGPNSLSFWPPLKTSPNAALNFALVSSVTGGVFVNAQGYTGS